MDIRPSPAQQFLVASAREFLAKHCPIELAQRLALDRDGLDRALWRQMAELGWTGLLAPPALGGSGGSLLDLVLLVEEMGRACLPGPFIPSAVIATTLAMRATTDAQRERLLPALASGERIATVALVEERGTFDLDAIELACGVPGRLAGRKLFVSHAHVADDLLVAVRTGDGRELGLVRLPATRAGVTRTALQAMGDARPFAVAFDGVDVVANDMLGAPDQGRAAITAALRAGALARTAEMVGAAQRVLELTIEHAKTRVQGGRPIGGYQAIQHACADLVRDVDTARGLLHAAAWSETEGVPSGADVAMAKAYAGERCLAVARRAHQIFGAISYCEQHPLHLLHTRIHAASLDGGDAALHLEEVARSLGLR